MIRLKLLMHIAKREDCFDPNGPLFHRWLPDGAKNAIALPCKDARNELRVWFERRGFLDGRFIRYERDRLEVDDEIMRRQGMLDAGPLSGEGVFCDISESELAALREDRPVEEEYAAVAKRILKFLYNPLHSFIETLRLQYGQCWLEELKPWDSRSESVEHYCSQKFGLRWRENITQDWRPLLAKPGEVSATATVRGMPGRGFEEFLTEADWTQIARKCSVTSVNPLALRIAARAHELNSMGLIAEAFIQAVTALELALEHYVAIRSKQFKERTKTCAHLFKTQSLKHQLSILSIANGAIPPDVVESALMGIDTRNKIVHEAIVPSSLSVDNLHALLKCIQVLLGLEEMKMPTVTGSNKISDWKNG